MHEDIPVTAPVLRYLHRTAIGPDMILELRYVRRIILEEIAPRIAYIDIQRITVTVEFPNSRKRHRAPSAVIIVHLIIIHGAVTGVFHPVELPETVQGHSLRLRYIESRGHSLAANPIDIRVSPCRIRCHNRCPVYVLCRQDTACQQYSH